MSTPTEQTRRGRHPEEFGRPDGPNAKNMAKWTGIGTPATQYEWDENPVHESKREVARPAGRATEELTRPPAITEYIPPVQTQVDPWGITTPLAVDGGERESLKQYPNPV